VDPNFNPGVPGQDSAVNALAVSGDGSTVYVGGGFEHIGGQPRNNLAAVEAATGKVTNFNPAGLGTDGQVFALKVSGTHVYVGGQFQNLGGQTRNGLAKVAGTTGGDLGWIPNPTLGAGGGLILAIEVSGDSVYVGGAFTNIGGLARRHLARLSAMSGNAFAEFAPNPDDAVFSLAISGTAVYAGGDFNNIAGQSRPTLARLDALTGTLTTFNANLVATDSVRALSLSGSELYLGGFLTSVGGEPRIAMAKVDATTGVVRAFDANIGGFDATVSVKTLAVAGTSVYAGRRLLVCEQGHTTRCRSARRRRRADIVQSGCRPWRSEYLQRRERNRRHGQCHLPRRQLHLHGRAAAEPDRKSIVGRHARSDFQPKCHGWQHSRRRHDRRHEHRRLCRRRFLQYRRPAADRSREVESDHGSRGRGKAILQPGSP
jgi:hypothetical protein